MKRTAITNTDLQCSNIVLGSVEMGSGLSEQESFRLMDAYADGGGNMVDTAEVYGNWLPDEKNVSETIIGKWMKQRRNQSELIVTTKGGHPDLSAMHTPRVTPEQIVIDLEGSLRRLQVETIDLYWLHRDDPSRPVGGILETLNDQIKAGKIRYFACSNWQTSRIAEAHSYAVEYGIQGFSASQVWWSLAEINHAKVLDTTLAIMDDEMNIYHRKTRMPLFAYSSQARGLFTKMESATAAKTDFKISELYNLSENEIRYEKLRRLAGELSVSISKIVLAYIHSQPFPSFAVIGSRTQDQLLDSMGSSEISLTADHLKFLTS
jgi:aryl-alcohol dehydrogenase-like predicted oxidoreductase